MSMTNHHDLREHTATDETPQRPYEAPAVIDEQTFETTVLGCTGQDLNCIIPQS
jgi:hypothetical protein